MSISEVWYSDLSLSNPELKGSILAGRKIV